MTDAELVARYCRQFNLVPPKGAALTAAMCRNHLALETEARAFLFTAPPDDRARFAARYYARLYRTCWWLTKWADQSKASPALDWGWWPSLLGDAVEVLEIGSGDGAAAKLLASHGYRVTATEISRRDDHEAVAVEWRETDGVHLTRIAGEAAFDAAISHQVLEHLHPDDVPVHLAEAFNALRPGGRLIFATPQRHVGPADVSWAFGFDEPRGMHLKEWTYRELVPLLRVAGFVDVRSVVIVPQRLRQWVNRAVASRAHLAWSRAIERMLDRLPPRRCRAVARRCRYLWFRGDVMIAARRPKR